MEDESKSLILEAFSLLDIKNPNIAACAFLSKEMQFILGETLSASTIYRMVNQDKQNVRSYPFSIGLVKRFIERKTLHPRNEKQFSSNYFSLSSVSDNALYILIRQQLIDGKIDDIGTFLGKLPMEHWSLGWEQYVIACALGETAKSKGINSVLGPLFELPQIRTYLLETYVDLNHPFNFYLPLLKKVGEQHQLFDLSGIDRQEVGVFGSSLFNISMAYLLCFLGRKQDNYDWESMILHPGMNEMLEHYKNKIPIPASRMYAARIISYGKKKDSAKLKQTLQQFIELQSDNSSISSREFSLALVCDALLLIDNRQELTFLLEKFPNPNSKPISFDPSNIRLELYRRVFVKKQHRFNPSAQDFSFQLGEQESDYHQLMIHLLLQSSKQHLQNNNARTMVQKTGFRHFGKLVL